MPRRYPGSYLVVALRVPGGGFVAWVLRAASAEEAIAAAHARQRRQGATGVTLSPRAVFDVQDALVWGEAAGIPASFLPVRVRVLNQWP